MKIEECTLGEHIIIAGMSYKIVKLRLNATRHSVTVSDGNRETLLTPADLEKAVPVSPTNIRSARKIDASEAFRKEQYFAAFRAMLPHHLTGYKPRELNEIILDHVDWAIEFWEKNK